MIPGVIATEPPLITPGGPTYHASGVHFAGAVQGQGPTYLAISSLAATDNGFYSFAFWSKGLSATANNSGIPFVHDSGGNYDPSSTIMPDGSFDVLSQPTGSGTLEFRTRLKSTVFTSTSWHHILFSSDVGHAAHSRLVDLILDGTRVTFSDTFNVGNFFAVTDAGASITSHFNGLQFVFGDDTLNDGPTADFADVWFAPGVSLLSGSTIPDATIAKFIVGGRPQDPIGFPSAPVLFKGGPSGFATNHGTGGAATLTGTLTASSTNP